MTDPDTPPAAAERRFASRKFILASALLAAGTVLLLAGKIDAATWLEISRWTLGMYCGANVGALAVDLFKGRAS